jgi:NAD+ synthase (glutamine-hydrolysing)
MPQALTLTAIQCNPTVGAVEANTQMVLSHIEANPDADLLLFPELSLTGYPPEDLLYRPGLYQHIQKSLQQIIDKSPAEQTVIIGHPELEDGSRYNQLSVIQKKRVSAIYRKQALPNYTTFDEPRYFTPGKSPTTIDCRGEKIGLLICEDSWTDSVVKAAVEDGATTLLISNASPYAVGKQERRISRIESICKQYGCNALYLNQVGGQDELVFDGRSFCVNAKGLCEHVAAHCQEDTLTLGTHKQSSQPSSEAEEIYQALVLGIHDYVHKNNFPGVLLGLSGGVDSALTLALAVDALGKEKVQAIMLPSRHTSSISLEDAEKQAKSLGNPYQCINIEPSYQCFLDTLAPNFKEFAPDTTEENIQARCRGIILMALSNKTGNMVLTTGNKSEMAVGYSTLYGDMAGGFAPLKDIYKTRVYELCRYRNSVNTVIPERVLTRAPSAELADNQTDQDSLPDYDVLDQLIELIVHEEKSMDEIAALGFDIHTVQDITRRIYRNEYKRRQAPIGIRVSQYAFGRDRRYPITNHYRA